MQIQHLSFFPLYISAPVQYDWIISLKHVVPQPVPQPANGTSVSPRSTHKLHQYD
jgi:hypothetical protein